MTKRILFIGGGAPVARAVATAAEAGFYTIVVHDEREPTAVAPAHKVILGQPANEPELARIARQARVDCIYPTAGPAAVAAATAAAYLGFFFLPPDAVALMEDRQAVRNAMLESGAAQPLFRVAGSVQEALVAAETLGAPVVVKPVRGRGGAGVSRIDYVEDVALGYIQAARVSKTVLIEKALEGRHLNVDGVVQKGAFEIISAHEAVPAAAPRCVEEAVYAPLEDGIAQELAAAAGAAARALGIESGVFSAEFIADCGLLHLIDLHPYPLHLRLPADLPCQHGTAAPAAAILQAVTGEPAKNPARQARNPLAIAWIPTHSGDVMSIEGVDEARGAFPGVTEISINAQVGDIMGHVVDAASRDRVGYVVATGDSARGALETATKAAQRCRIVTSPAI